MDPARPAFLSTDFPTLPAQPAIAPRGVRGMRTAFLLAAVLATALAGCDDTMQAGGEDRSSGATAPEAAAAAGQPSEGAAVTALTAQLSPQMQYAQLRRQALAADWLPIEDPDCAQNVGGEARVCRLLPETEACSSDGRCVLWLGHAPSSSRLRVDTYGDATRWSGSGDSTDVAVRAWNFSDAPPAAPATACPAPGFDDFLAAYAGDDAVRQAFTRPLVSVIRYRQLGEDSDTYPALVAAAQYDGFRLRHADDGYHVAAADGGVDPATTAVERSEVSPGTFRVSYRYGMSEGRAYLFQRQGDCWVLAGEPDPPVA